jgi:type IV fimbrial biogenesis protein FimT
VKSGKRVGEARHKAKEGFTILEVLITLAAIAIVVLVTVPGSNMLLEKYRLKTASGSLLSGLELARSEAHQRSITVMMCPSSNAHTCRRDGDWSMGWLVFTDGNGNGTVQDIELIQAFEAPHQTVKIMAQGAVQNQVAFTATGLNADNGKQTGKFQICLDGSEAAPKIVKVDAEGWIQMVKVDEEVCQTG